MRAARTNPGPLRMRAFGTGLALLVLALCLFACSRAGDPAESPEAGAGEAIVNDPRALDVVLTGGRVMDPETGLDAVRNVGIRGGSIVAISEDELTGALVEDGVAIDATGLVVAPGFIDMHAHGQSNEANEYQMHDGVTTALELEWGYPRVGAWIEHRRGNARIHYGASVSHGMVRTLVIPEMLEQATQLEAELDQAATAAEPLRALQSSVAKGFYLPLAEDARALPALYAELRRELDRGLEEGALGFGMAHAYYPGTTREEIFRVFELAAERGATVYTHVSGRGMSAMQEVVANAAATGAPLHIVHVNSSSLSELPQVLELIAGARAHGVDVTTESYPYTAGSTSLSSSLFDEGWQEALDADYGDIQWQDTGERLTKESFERYRKQGGTVIIHNQKAELIDLAVSTPWLILASDGMPYAPGAHPRSAGTFSRVLGRYVRERGVLDLMTALTKMTLLPAQRLESVAPQMAKKGRVQNGADADLTLFDPETIVDTATFEDDLSFSVGVHHVLVGGTFVVRDKATVEDAFPGQPILGRWAQADS